MKAIRKAYRFLDTKLRPAGANLPHLLHPNLLPNSKPSLSAPAPSSLSLISSVSLLASIPELPFPLSNSPFRPPTYTPLLGPTLRFTVAYRWAMSSSRSSQISMPCTSSATVTGTPSPVGTCGHQENFHPVVEQSKHLEHQWEGCQGDGDKYENMKCIPGRMKSLA